MFTKNDLKNKMIVITGDGTRYFVVDNLLFSLTGYMSINDYDDDLELIEEEHKQDFNIVEVWKTNTAFGDGFDLLRKSNPLFGWERIYCRDDDIREYPVENMTMTDICKALRKRVRIIPEGFV